MDERKGTRPLKNTRILDYVIGFVSFLLILAPAALGVLYVRAFGVSVVFGDAWSIVLLFDKWSSGTLQLSDLFDQHNEHRVFFPQGVELLLGSITKYDNVAEMYLIQICFLVTLVILFLAFRQNIKSAWLFLFVPISLLIFSFRQYENMLFGYQIGFAFTQTFGVLSLFLLYVSGHRRFKKLAFVAALGSGTVASYSVLQGLFVWPAGLLQLFISPLEKPTKRIFIVVWSLVGLGEWVAYFIDYSKPKNGPSLLYALEHPAAGAEYFLNLLGSSLFLRQNLAFMSGVLLAGLALVSLIMIYRYRRWGEYSFWLSLLLYSFLMLAAITLGRSGIAVEQAMASRYTSFSILLVVSVYAMLVKAVFERRSIINTVLLLTLSGVVLLGVAMSYPREIEEGSKERASREKAAFVLATYESQPDDALKESLRSRARIIRERAAVLQRLGYNVFSERQAPGSLPPLSALSPVASPTSSAIDSLTTDAKSGAGIDQQNRAIVVPEGASFIKLTGWAVDAKRENAAGGVYVDIDGKLFPAFYGIGRQDVANSLGVSSYRYSGFERAIPTSEIGVGTHELSVIVLTNDREGYYRPDQKVAFGVR